MELIITKNGHIFARATDVDTVATDVYALRLEQTVPAYPEISAGVGKQWELDYDGDTLVWVAKDRPLSSEERLEKVEEEIKEQKYAWKSGEAVNVGDLRFYKEHWYVCIQAHITQDDWTPDVTPALWRQK